MATDLTKSSPLAEELALFEQKKGELLKHNKGQFALIKGPNLVGTFTTFDEAYAAGVTEFGNQPMLVKQILEQEPTEQAPAYSLGILATHSS